MIPEHIGSDDIDLIIRHEFEHIKSGVLLIKFCINILCCVFWFNRSEVFTAYQRDARKKDRLRGTWTLGEYERSYRRYFVDVVKAADSYWRVGDEFDKDIIRGITREDVEQYISSDGSELTLNK